MVAHNDTVFRILLEPLQGGFAGHCRSVVKQMFSDTSAKRTTAKTGHVDNGRSFQDGRWVTLRLGIMRETFTHFGRCGTFRGFSQKHPDTTVGSTRLANWTNSAGLESSGSDLIFMIRTAALAEPDLGRYTIRLPV